MIAEIALVAALYYGLVVSRTVQAYAAPCKSVPFKYIPAELLSSVLQVASSTGQKVVSRPNSARLTHSQAADRSVSRSLAGQTCLRVETGVGMKADLVSNMAVFSENAIPKTARAILVSLAACIHTGRLQICLLIVEFRFCFVCTPCKPS